ncbi:hypothetical protein D9M68_935150 [compost metagenome]
MKSLKWPDCNAASCRLSVNPSSLRRAFSAGTCPRSIQSSAVAVMSVVAELRPSAERPASLLMSRACGGGWLRQCGQKRNLPGKNQARTPSMSPRPSAPSNIMRPSCLPRWLDLRRGSPDLVTSNQSSG